MHDQPYESLDSVIELVDLSKISDPRGNLTFIEGNRHVPFDIKRVYYLYDVPVARCAPDTRTISCNNSSSAYPELRSRPDNGYERRTITCNRPFRGVLMKSLVWRELNNFSSGAVCLVLASMPYEESDYIRDYQDFLKTVEQRRLK